MDTPEYSANEGTPDALPKGGATQLNNALEEVQNVDMSRVEDPTAFPEEMIDDTVPPMEGDLTGMDHLVFAGSDRPQEPITAGIPQGPGPSFVNDGRTARQQLEDMAYRMANDPVTTPTSKAMMAKILRGD